MKADKTWEGTSEEYNGKRELFVAKEDEPAVIVLRTGEEASQFESGVAQDTRREEFAPSDSKTAKWTHQREKVRESLVHTVGKHESHGGQVCETAAQATKGGKGDRNEVSGKMLRGTGLSGANVFDKGVGVSGSNAISDVIT